MNTPKNQVSTSDTGRRVSFQFVLPNGHNKEVVGTFEFFDDAARTFMVKNRDGDLVRVPERDVRYGKIVS